MKKLALFVSVLFLLTSCNTVPNKEPRVPDLGYPQELQDVLSLIEEKKYEDALSRADDYLNKADNIKWYGHAWFLKGFVYESSERLQQAMAQYREAIQHAANYDSRVEAKALYNLSFVYEKSEKYEELVASLLDLMKRPQFFDAITSKVETPARLAAAYARQHQMQPAKEFHKRGSQAFAKMVRRSNLTVSREDLSKSLYYLGLDVYDANQENYGELIEKLQIGQPYFLASAEASNSMWSEKSVKRLENEYSKAWGMVIDYKPKGFDHDTLAFEKNKQSQQLEMAAQLYDLMHVLQVEEFPMGRVNNRSNEMIRGSEKWVDKIEKFAISLDLGPATIRKTKIKNTKLAVYVESKREEVRVNKETQQVSSSKKTSQVEQNSSAQSEKDSKSETTKENIGKDPNL